MPKELKNIGDDIFYLNEEIFLSLDIKKDSVEEKQYHDFVEEVTEKAFNPRGIINIDKDKKNTLQDKDFYKIVLNIQAEFKKAKIKLKPNVIANVCTTGEDEIEEYFNDEGIIKTKKSTSAIRKACEDLYKAYRKKFSMPTLPYGGDCVNYKQAEKFRWELGRWYGRRTNQRCF